MLKMNLHLIRRLVLGAAVAIVFAAAPQLAQAQTPGSLAQLSTPCVQSTNIEEGGDCPDSTAPGLSGADGVATIGDNVYVISSDDDAIAEFSRNPDGSLASIGCIVDSSADSSTCDSTTATGLVRPEAIAVSPDGQNVYVSAEDSHDIGDIAEFARNSDGTLTQLSPNDCIAENTGQTDGEASDCANQSGHGIASPRALAVSPDGQNVYVVDSNQDDIAEFARNGNGSLNQLNGADDCIVDQNIESSDCGTTTGSGLQEVDAVTVSPDGNNVYTGAENSEGGPGALAEFTRAASGALAELGCIQEQGGSECDNETGIGLNNVASVVASPDGDNVYASSFGEQGSIADFARGANGVLTQLASPNDCIEEQGSDEGCGTSGNGLDGASGVQMSPDGASLYVATNEDDCCDAAIAEFARGSDGSLAQLPSPDNCIDENGEDCGNDNGTGLGGGALAVSTDGDNVYVIGGDSDVSQFARTPVQYTLTVSLAGTGSGAVSGTGGIACLPTCSQVYTANNRVTLTAAPSNGSTFAGWSGGCTGTGACQVTMSADMGVTATFTAAGSPGAPTPVTTGAPSAVTDSGAGVSGSVNPEGLPTTVYFQYGLDKRYSQVGASGPNYTAQTASQQVGSDFANHIVGPINVAGLVPNALYHVRLVATNSAGTTYGQDVTFTTALAPLPGTPTLGQTFNIAPVSGLVLIYIHGHLVPLTQLEQIGPGVTIDTLHGTLQLTINPGGGGPAGDGAHDTKVKTQTGQFGGAVFRLHQASSGANKGLTTVMLAENAFKGAPGQARCTAPGAASDAHAAKSNTKVIQLLHASAHGKFATSGRYSAATVLGTVWDTIARCDGTLVKDIKDEVVVKDFIRHKTILLHAGQSYLAPGPPK